MTTQQPAPEPKRHQSTTRTRLPLSRRTYNLDPSQHARTRSTLGLSLSFADEFDVKDGIRRLLGGEATEKQMAAALKGYRRDLAIARAGHRWSGHPLTPRNIEYLPGDVCGLRASAVQGSMSTTARVFEDPARELDGEEPSDLAWEAPQAALVYDAVPYFVPTLTTLGIVGSEPPGADLLSEIHLPFPRVAVFFGADMALPPTLVGGEDVLRERIAFENVLVRDGKEEMPAHLVPPVRVPATHLALYRRTPVCLTGVLLSSGPNGAGLDDLVFWFSVADLNKGGVTRRVDPGSLSSATLAPVAYNLAAAIAWGPWKPPDRPLDLPDNTTSKAFKDALRRGQFRRREASGAAVGVHVIDVTSPRPEPKDTTEATHASPVTHLRRGHTRRQRVGPHDDWHYEIRWINPVVVNPGFATGPGGITVYRLPDPTS